MSGPLIMLCPGQGAQSVGMGRGWFDRSPEAKRVFAAADQVLSGRLGSPLSEVCFAGPAERLNRTDIAQPALFVVGVASYQAAFGGHDSGSLAAAAGLSLGEYTALHLAGAISFADALEVVAVRGAAMQAAAEASPSGMVALVGADESSAGLLCERVLGEVGGGEVLVPANFNAPGQVVLSGSSAACERAASVAGEFGLRASKLAVAGAFHSPLMSSAAERLGEALSGVSLTAPSCPVLSNATGRPHGEGGDGSEGVAGSIRRGLVDQLTSPVRWTENCRWLLEHAEGSYHEVAPGTVLSGLMRRIDRGTKVQSHDQPEA